VARAIAGEVKIRLTVQEESLLSRARSVHPAAHEAYLKGRYYLHKISEEGVRRAIGFFHQALDADPTSALAYSGLAESYVVLGFSGFSPADEVMPQAKAAALRAVEMDEFLAEGHGSLGWVHQYYDWNWPAADTAYKRAIELNPNDAVTRGFYAVFLAANERAEEAITQGLRSLELDPLSLPTRASFASILVSVGRYDEAMEQCRKIIEIDPNVFWAYFHLWRACHQKGMNEEALEACAKLFALWGNTEVAEALQHAYTQSSYERAMHEGADILVAQAKAVYVMPTLIAIMYGHAEEKDQVCVWLEKAHGDRDPLMANLNTLPAFKDLRSEPCFQEILRRMNFPE
jgi:tetratricopeptide (TPR) repeat protein